MIAYLPIPGGHIKLAERFVDPALSFTMGWNYWYCWAILLPTEMSAAAVLMSFWKSVSKTERGLQFDDLRRRVASLKKSVRPSGSRCAFPL